MSLILNIDTATEQAYINIAENGVSLGEAFNKDMKDHAGFLQTAIRSLSEKTGIPLKKLDAIAVIAGPGSYTGLRVAMASAKGLCYALDKPLITISSLTALADLAHQQKNLFPDADAAFICPMIDARRMEVFTALYNNQLEMTGPVEALILSDNSFEHILLNNKIIFCGNGSAKWATICNHPNALFLTLNIDAAYMSGLSYTEFCAGNFASTAYSEPLYGKEFFTTQKTT